MSDVRINSFMFTFSSAGSATVKVVVAELCLQAPIRYMAAVNIIYIIK